MHAYDVDPNASEERRPSYGTVAKMYGVPFLPTTFLLDSNRKILLRNPSKEEQGAKLKEIFGY